MKTLKDLLFDPYLMILLKGEPDSGKTEFISHFPFPMLYLDFDGKAHSLARNLIKRGIGLDDKRYIDYRFFSRNDLDKFDQLVEELIDNKGRNYATVACDSLTTIATHSVDFFSKHTPLSKKEKSGQSDRIIRGIKLPGFTEYGGEFKVLNVLIEMFMALECHRILTAHIVAGDKPEWQRQVVTAGKKPAAMLPAVFPEIYHLETNKSGDPEGDNEYIVRTKSTGSDFARSSMQCKSTFDWTNKNVFEILTTIAARTGRNLKQGIMPKREEQTSEEGNPVSVESSLNPKPESEPVLNS